MTFAALNCRSLFYTETIFKVTCFGECSEMFQEFTGVKTVAIPVPECSRRDVVDLTGRCRSTLGFRHARGHARVTVNSFFNLTSHDPPKSLPKAHATHLRSRRSLADFIHPSDVILRAHVSPRHGDVTAEIRVSPHSAVTSPG